MVGWLRPYTRRDSVDRRAIGTPATRPPCDTRSRHWRWAECTMFSPATHVQGVRLNHALFFGRRTQLCSETALGYDVVARRLRQEVQHGHCSAADISRGTFALNPGSVTAPGGRHAH